MVKKYELKAQLQPMPEGFPISATIVADSISPDGVRISTLELVFPRIILAELNTHRAVSKNASSSRAIPTLKLVARALKEMVEPVRYGRNRAGMQAAKENLGGADLEEAKKIWRDMANYCAAGCSRLAELGLHKQWASRPVEWFSTIKVLVTATEFENLFNLRDHGDAQDEIAHLVQQVKMALNGSTPRLRLRGQWHLPYVTDEEFSKLGNKLALKVSSARAARTSYKTVHGVTSTIEEDLLLYERLYRKGPSDLDNPFHASPFEHQACPAPDVGEDMFERALLGNFQGWYQHRKFLEHGLEI